MTAKQKLIAILSVALRQDCGAVLIRRYNGGAVFKIPNLVVRFSEEEANSNNSEELMIRFATARVLDARRRQRRAPKGRKDRK